PMAGRVSALVAACGLLHLVVMRVGNEAATVGPADRFGVASTQSEAAPLRMAGAGASGVRSPGPMMPLVAIDPVVTVGTSAPRFHAAGLQQKLQNALSRFHQGRVPIQPAA